MRKRDFQSMFADICVAITEYEDGYKGASKHMYNALMEVWKVLESSEVDEWNGSILIRTKHED